MTRYEERFGFGEQMDYFFDKDGNVVFTSSHIKDEYKAFEAINTLLRKIFGEE